MVEMHQGSECMQALLELSSMVLPHADILLQLMEGDSCDTSEVHAPSS